MNSPRHYPEHEHLDAGLTHIQQALDQGHLAGGAAKGLLYGLTETLGVLLGDPSLPDQLRDGYQGLMDNARDLQQRLNEH